MTVAIVLAAVVGVLGGDGGGADRGKTVLWVWNDAASPLASAAAAARFFEFVAGKTGVQGPMAPTLALLEAEALGKNASVAATLKVLLPQFAAHNISVAPLYGWNARDSGPFPSTAAILEWVDSALELAADSTAVTGVSLDIEPAIGDPTSYQSYADLLLAVRRHLGGLSAAATPPRLHLSIAGSWAYSEHNVSCDGRFTTMLECAVTLVDLYILMNYRNNAYGCFCRPPPERNPAHLECPPDGSPIAGNCSITVAPGSDGMIGKATETASAVRQVAGRCRLALGVETSCFPPSDEADRRYQYKLSFCNTSMDYLDQQIALTEQGLKTKGLWDGVASDSTPWAVEDYTALRALANAP